MTDTVIDIPARPIAVPVPRIARQLDAAGGLLLLAGAACYGYAWLGFRSLPVRYPDLSAARAGGFLPPPGAVAEADRLFGWSRVGVGIFAVGALVILVGVVIAARRRRAPSEVAAS